MTGTHAAVTGIAAKRQWGLQFGRVGIGSHAAGGPPGGCSRPGTLPGAGQSRRRAGAQPADRSDP